MIEIKKPLTEKEVGDQLIADLYSEGWDKVLEQFPLPRDPRKGKRSGSYKMDGVSVRERVIWEFKAVEKLAGPKDDRYLTRVNLTAGLEQLEFYTKKLYDRAPFAEAWTGIVTNGQEFWIARFYRGKRVSGWETTTWETILGLQGCNRKPDWKTWGLMKAKAIRRWDNGQLLRICPQCRQELPETGFPNPRKSYCHLCNREYQRDWVAGCAKPPQMGKPISEAGEAPSEERVAAGPSPLPSGRDNSPISGTPARTSKVTSNGTLGAI